jgi:putative endonuclease
MTNSLEVRVWQHKSKSVPGFTARYNIDRLIYFADFSDVHQALD